MEWSMCCDGFLVYKYYIQIKSNDKKERKKAMFMNGWDGMDGYLWEEFEISEQKGYEKWFT